MAVIGSGHNLSEIHRLIHKRGDEMTHDELDALLADLFTLIERRARRDREMIAAIMTYIGGV